jgi:GH25 family lysozyme M1 (1,4-beta-N-acetylmuramidase)
MLRRVADWQRAQGLGADGMIGPLTLARMEQVLSAAPSTPLTHPPPAQARRAVVPDLAQASQDHPDEMWALDLSNNRPSVDLAWVRANTNTRGLIVKATEGRHFIDPTADRYADQARALGLEVGAFCWPWPRWQGRDAEMLPQAQSFGRWWRAAQARGPMRLGAWVDMEAGNSPPDNVEVAIAAWGIDRTVQWFADLADACDQACGERVGVYTNLKTIRRLGVARLQRARLLGPRPLWYAYYPTGGGQLPAQMPPVGTGADAALRAAVGDAWAMWQMASSAQVRGGGRGVDLNVVRRDSAMYQILRGGC